MGRKFTILTPPVFPSEPQHTKILNWLAEYGFDMAWMVRCAAISCVYYGKHVNENQYVSDEFANEFAEIVEGCLNKDDESCPPVGPEADARYALIVEAAQLFYDICLHVCNDLGPYVGDGELDSAEERMFDVTAVATPIGFRIDIEFREELDDTADVVAEETVEEEDNDD